MKTAFFAAAVAALSVAMGATAAEASTVYSNDFQAGAAGFAGGSILTAPNGQKFLGAFTQGGSTVLTLNTAGLSSLTLELDLYAVASVDGDGPFGGNSLQNPDAFTITRDGGVGIFTTGNTFANFADETQSYGGVGSLPQTGAVSVNTLGYSGPGNTDDALYHLSFTFAPTAGGMTAITFTGNSNQDASDEFFGIDNVNVSGVKAAGGVPEPATWTMMLVGFGGLGAMIRRRRTSVQTA